MAVNTSALSFNGVNQYVKLSNSVTIRKQRQFTYMFSFKVGPGAVDANRHHAFVERQGTGTGIRFRFTPVAGKLQFGFSPKDGVADTSYTYNTKWDDRWHVAAFSASIGTTRSTYTILLDAVEVATGTLVIPAGVEEISDTAPKGVYVGGYSRLNSGESFPSTQMWEGKLDDLILLKSSMNQGSMNTYLTAHDEWEWDDPDVEPENENTLSYWKFDDNAGTTTRDTVDTNRTGTLSSSAIWTIDRPYIGNGVVDTTPPSTPGSPTTSNVTSDGFTATWTASTDNVWVQFYELQVSEFNNFSSYMAFDTGRGLSRNVSGLFPGVNYYWRVRAFDAELNASSYTVVQSLTTPTIGDLQPPNPPTNIAASHVTHSSFRITFDQSISSDVVGYKLDVGLDAQFSAYLPEYRGRNIGNTDLIDIFGTQELTSYYIRLRSYDSFDNESLHSVVLRVNTPRKPDTIPPQVVQGTLATGISSRAATLSWETGIDNVAVLGYYLDISTVSDFSSFVLTDSQHWQSADVGNVTDFYVDRLEPDTVYYYRVRAYDEAGNVSQNTEEPTEFLTQPSNMFEGGYVDSTIFPETWTVDSAVRPDVIQITDTNTLTLVYDTRDTVGTPARALLQIMPRDWTVPTTFGSIRVTARVQGTGVDLGSQEISITQVDELLEIDVSSFVAGTTGTFEFDIESLGFLGYIDAGVEIEGFNEFGATPPNLALSSDPMSSTQPLEMVFESVEFDRTNFFKNPSFESDLSGWEATTNATLTQVAEPSDGYQALRVSTTAAGAGVRLADTSYYIPLAQGQRFYFSADIKGTPGTQRVNFVVHTTNAVGADTGILVQKNFEIDTYYNRYAVYGDAPPEAVFARVAIYSINAGNQAFVVDNFLAEQSEVLGSAFNGNTYGARWLGTANASTSRIDAAKMRVLSPYIGDENDNNSAVAHFMHQPDAAEHLSDHADWYPFTLPVSVDRGIKRYTAIVPQSFGMYNLVRNPSFEVDEQLWVGGDRVTTRGHFGSCSYLAAEEAEYLPFVAVEPSAPFVLHAEFLPDAEGLVTLHAIEYDASRGSVFTHVVEGPFGDGETWQQDVYTFTTTATTRFIRFWFTCTKPFYVDGVFLGPYDGHTSYRDGSILDGVWEGIPHLSTTGIQIKSGEQYNVAMHYTDPEGFFDISDDKDYYHIQPFIAPDAPDEATTFSNLELSATENAIHGELTYIGDDNENMTAQIEFKRSDLTTWSLVRPIYDRKNKKVLVNIPDLRQGTSYMVRFALSDVDGLFGMISGTIVDEITTNIPQQAIDADPHVSFGGFVLQGRQDEKIGVTMHNAFGFPSRNIQIEPIPRVDGTTQLQSLWREKEIRMSGFISGDSRADLDDVKTALLRALSQPSQRLIIDSLSRRGRFYYATCESLDISEDASENIRHLEWSAQFVCADPFAYDVVETALPRFTSPHNGSIALQNNGDVRVRPYMEVTTTDSFAITVSIYNTSTGERITPKSTIIRGDRLTIDSERKSVQKNGVEIDYAGGFVELSPGANIITFSLASQGTTPTVNVVARWRDKYL